MAALLSFSHSLHTNHSFHQLKKPSSRTNNFLITCSSQLPTGKERISEHKEEVKKKKQQQLLWRGVMEELGRRGMKLESLMSPKHKGGDWKDLVLMSLSFAVYVYISQRLVCTYCAWISLLKQHSF